MGRLYLVVLLGFCTLAAWACGEPTGEGAEDAASPESEEPFSAFDAWLNDYRTSPDRTRPLLEEDGIALARRRLDGLRRLAEQDPAQAVDRRLPFHVYRDLPDALRPWMERPIDAVGRYEVVCRVDLEGRHEEERWIEIDGERFRALTYGRRLEALTTDTLRVHGLLVDDVLVLDENPLRELMPGELPAGAEVDGPAGCEAGAAERLFHTGEGLARVCGDEEASALETRILAMEQSFTAASTWTTGHKNILYIRIDFSDAPGGIITEAQARAVVDGEVDSFFDVVSYGQVSISTVVTPVLRMPQTKAWYESQWNRDILLRNAALGAATIAGFPPAIYDNDIIAFATLNDEFSWAYRGARGVMINGPRAANDVYLYAHELGHSFGLGHAKSYEAAGETIIGPGRLIEYGHFWDVLGGRGFRPVHMQARYRNLLDWLPDSRVKHVTSSGIFRIFDLGSPLPPGNQALRITKSTSDSYWLEYHPIFGDTSATQGVSINVGSDADAGSSFLLDMTPWTPIGVVGWEDSELRVGRAFEDPFASLRITPLQVVNGVPPALDVAVHIGPREGSPPDLAISASRTAANVAAPIGFTASAFDPDGDTLHYSWDFGNGTLATGAQVVAHYFEAGVYHVRCTVDDLRGNATTRSIPVTIGNPSGHVLSGTVRLESEPLPGVRITDGTRSAWTDSNGFFRLYVPAGITVSLGGHAAWYQVTPSDFVNPVQVGSDLPGLDFAASPAGFSLAGHVRSSGVGLPGAEVNIGTFHATTDTAGAWGLTVPAGSYNASVTRIGTRSFQPAFALPLAVFGSRTGLDFQEILHSVSGRIHGASGSATITDGTRSTTSYLGNDGVWYYQLTGIPAGTWHIVGTLPGFTLAPAAVPNPVPVVTDVTGVDLVATPGDSHAICGRLLDAVGRPIAAHPVQTGAHETLTDSDGRYFFTGLADGDYTVAPDPAAVPAFGPASRAVTIAGADFCGADFVAVAPNEPPRIVTPAAPASVTISGDSVALSVLADDDGGEAALVYAWSVLDGPPGVSFDQNHSNEARNVMATFSLPGTYTLQANATDAQGLMATSLTAVEVAPGTATVVISPSHAYVPFGETQTFTATAYDQFGAPFDAGSWVWLVSGGGPITSEGTFIATTYAPNSVAPSANTYTVHGTAGGLSGAARVTVLRPGQPRIVSLSPAQGVITGASLGLSVLVDFDGGEANLMYLWSKISGPGDVSFSANITNAAKNTVATFTQPGVYQLKIYVFPQAGGLAIEGFAQVEVLRTFTATITPATWTMRVGEVQNFVARVADQFGVELAPGGSFTWTTSGGGTLSAVNGTSTSFTATQQGGPYTITAAKQGHTGTAEVAIQPSLTPVITVGAEPAQPIVSGASVSLAVLADDDMGEANLTYTWSKVGGAGTTVFSANGTNAAKNTVVTFGGAGTYSFQVAVRDTTNRTATSTTQVEVVQTPTSALASPATATVRMGETQSFSATGRDQFGHDLAVPPTWTWSTSGGGTIDSAGVYTGTARGGPFTATATAPGLTANASVTVLLPRTPGIVTPATPVQATVTGTSVALSTLADDDLGEAGLSYTWAMTSGPVAPFFAPNGTNAAKNTVATFRQAGAYVLEVRVVDADGRSTTSSTQVEVLPLLATTSILPGTATVRMGETEPFAASAVDQFGWPHAGATWIWTVSGGGTIDPSGLFTATTRGGPFTITASRPDASPTATVTVLLPRTPGIVEAAAPATPVVEGTSVSLSVLADDDLGEAQLTYTWSMTGGPAPAAFSANGTNAAKQTVATFAEAGTYAFEVVVADGDGRTTSSATEVRVDPTLSVLAIVPEAMALPLGESETFAASAFDQFGAPYASAEVWGWTTTAGGTIDQAGLFTAEIIGGPFTVAAALEEMTATASVTVGLARTPTILVEAASEGATEQGKVRLSVVADDDEGEGNLTYTWRVVDGDAATFEPNGTHRASETDAIFAGKGRHRLVVRVEDSTGLHEESELELNVLPWVASLALTPASALARVGEAIVFAAELVDQVGEPLAAPPVFAWSTSGGAQVVDGVFTAERPGRYEVRVEVAGLSATATVEVEPNGPDDPPKKTAGCGGGCNTGGGGDPTWLVGVALLAATLRRRSRA